MGKYRERPDSSGMRLGYVMSEIAENDFVENLESIGLRLRKYSDEVIMSKTERISRLDVLYKELDKRHLVYRKRQALIGNWHR